MAKPGPKVDPTLGPLTSMRVCLDAETVRLLKVLGGENTKGSKSISEGIRRAARVAYRDYQRRA